MVVVTPMGVRSWLVVRRQNARRVRNPGRAFVCRSEGRGMLREQPSDGRNGPVDRPV